MNLFQWLLASVLLLLLGWHLRHATWTESRAFGAGILLLAFALVSAARYQLGRSFSLTAQARQLITTGLYARIRNPIYVFACLAFFGFALLLQRWWPVALLLVVIPLQRRRARREAAVLEAAFGDEYRRYRERTWF